jgi:hypothetical protein
MQRSRMRKALKAIPPSTPTHFVADALEKNVTNRTTRTRIVARHERRKTAAR